MESKSKDIFCFMLLLILQHSYLHNKTHSVISVYITLKRATLSIKGGIYKHFIRYVLLTYAHGDFFYSQRHILRGRKVNIHVAINK